MPSVKVVIVVTPKMSTGALFVYDLSAVFIVATVLALNSCLS